MCFRHFWLIALSIGLQGCAVPAPDNRPLDPLQTRQLSQLLPADAILLGEQHDAPDHQRIQRLVVESLVNQHLLAALALEMAGAGQSTDQLDRAADENQVRAALQWDNESWPWATYSPAIMAAVRAGVPVLGANLPSAGLHDAMRNAKLDQLLTGPALKAQQQNIRRGHCELLPESQISPMTRIQIARDVAMAETLIKAARPGKTVVLLAGSGHVERALGIPQHLPLEFKVKTIILRAEQASPATEFIAKEDQVWTAQPAPLVDYCANFIATPGKPAAATTPEKMP